MSESFHFAFLFWQSKDMAFINRILKDEKNEEEERRTELMFLEKKIENEKIRNKESLLDELVSSASSSASFCWSKCY